MKAVILAGGKGTRLRPLTYAVPKPLLPLQEKPIIEHIMLHLKEHNVTDIIIALGYLGYQIKNCFHDGKDLGVSIKYQQEKKALGTAGCLYAIKDELKDAPFLVMGGDNFTNIDITKMLEFHNEKKATVTIALIEMSIPVDFGVVELNEDCSIQKFREKPKFDYLGSTMIYCVNPEVLEYIEEGDDFAKDVFPKLIADNKKIYGYEFKDVWIDIGRIEEYTRANDIAGCICVKKE
ncbi:MAG: nucleotidyltransferase family protein [Candidatus Aenigmarchaeota archaeon]|nr:nucleotidyltransferase family protein [Candidatus Aenigmarchaeota archaeon]